MVGQQSRLSTDTPRAAARRAELKEALRLQNYRSNALGVHLGQRYESDAVIPDGTRCPVQTRDPMLHYSPTTHPGASLPHAWLQAGTARISTLDLVGGGEFTLITGVAGEAWARAATLASSELGVPLRIVRIGYRCECNDVLGEWADRSEIDDDGALLVRPDRHIAWRSLQSVDRPNETLRAALQTCLSLGGERQGQQSHKATA